MTCYAYSTAPNPVAVVHNLYASRGGTMSRQEFILMCEKHGVNRNTASTQYNVCRKRQLRGTNAHR